jgi:hypothetical protein
VRLQWFRIRLLRQWISAAPPTKVGTGPPQKPQKKDARDATGPPRGEKSPPRDRFWWRGPPRDSARAGETRGAMGWLSLSCQSALWLRARGSPLGPRGKPGGERWVEDGALVLWCLFLNPHQPHARLKTRRRRERNTNERCGPFQRSRGGFRRNPPGGVGLGVRVWASCRRWRSNPSIRKMLARAADTGYSD